MNSGVFPSASSAESQSRLVASSHALLPLGQPARKRLNFRAGRSAPDFARYLRHKLKLRPLIVFGDEVSFHRGSKAALRADCKLLQWNDFGGLVDAAEEILFTLKRGALGAYQPEDDGFPLGNKAQRLKAAGAVVVVFKQEAIDFELVEEALGDGVVASFRVPVAAVVPSAKMDRQRNARLARGSKARVISNQRSGEHLRRIDAQLLLHPRCPLWVEVVAVARRVNLEVRNAAARE